MDDSELIEEHKAGLKEANEFFSNPNKRQRELFTVREFLLNLGVSFKENDLEFVSDDPPDIIFHDARFEIKELLDKGRKRHEEYKNALKKAESADKFSDLLELYTLAEVSLDKVIGLINEQLNEINYSPDVCRHLDILFYVNLHRKGILIENKRVSFKDESWHKWRSLSIVGNSSLSCVLWASPQAPDFLKLIEGNIIVRKALNSY